MRAASKKTRDNGRLPILLEGQSYRASLESACLDFQSRLGRPKTARGDGLAPCVLLLSRAVDREADNLSLRLAAEGVAALRLDSDRCPGESVCWDPDRGSLTVGGDTFSPRVAWLRCFTPQSIPSCGDPWLNGYVRDQWASWTAVLCDHASMIRINGRGAPGARNRVAQLAAAREAGLTIPITCVTSRPSDALRCVPGDGDLVVKPLGEHYVEISPGQAGGVFARRISRDVAAGCGTEAAPVLIQDFIPAERELRVYIIGGRLITFAVVKNSPEALWTDPAGVEVSLVATPAKLHDPLQRLAERWGLQVAAFDILDTPRGYVFLEVNVTCEWLWFERVAGCAPVSEAVAELVVTLFRRAS